MSKKRGFFRGYRHGNRSMPKLLGTRDTESTPSDGKSMLEIALDKANTAVLYDQADDFDAAIRSYKEAVGLLEGFFDTAGSEDRSRLQKIYESYTERIQTLSEQIATTATESSNSTISSSDHSSMLHTLAEGTSWRTPKKKMIFDDASSTHTTDSSKTTMGGFVSMFAKRSQTKLHQIPTAFNVDPKPSKSTPISSSSRPSKTWLPLSGTKKKRHSSEYAKEKSVTPQEMIPPPELPVIAPVTDSDDYFDLRSTGAADLLLPTSRYSFLKDPPIQSTTPQPQPQPLTSISANPLTNTKHSSTKKKSNDIQSANAMEDAMDNLAKVLEESSMAFTTEEDEEESTVTVEQEKTSSRLLQHQQDRRATGISSFWRSSPSLAGRNNKPTLTLQKRSTRIRSNSNASSTSSSTAASSPPTSPPSRWASFEQARTFSSLALSPKDQQQQQQRPLSTFTTASSIVNTSSSLESAPFMNQPPAIVSPVTIHLSLMQRLSRSMVEGAYLTERLYVPKELWYQSNIRLPALDAKLAACELLIAGLERLALLDDVTDIPLAQKELCLLEQSLEHIRDTFARKLGIMQQDNHDDGNNNNNPTSSNTTNNSNNNNNTHSIPSSPSSSTSITATKSSLSSWSNKLSKSVERMKLESSRTLDHQYIQTLINLLSSTQILDAWHTQYSEILRCEPSEEHYLPLLVKVETVTETMQKIVCGFILRDFSILFNKWSKRSRQCLVD
ncbi:hypothetical protein K492DRAFT_205943 [Lichtheimia hyalospora FSU 10163]|nr:hypothetical protein K492DRAFT_205943 [Lichtheimia hyalospora FSU 10163]